MPKKIKKKIKGNDFDMEAFSVSCPHKEDAIWVVQSTLVGNDGFPAMDYCKEVCLFKCGSKCTIQKIEL